MGMERSIPWLVISSLLPLLFSFLIIRRRKKTTEWPPCPPTLPFLGNLHQLGHASSLHHNLAKLAGLHGRLMTIFAGSWQPTIVVSDGELAREVLVTRSALFADRSLPPAGIPLSANYRTVGTSVPDTHWHALRRGLQAGPFGPANLASQFKYQEEDVEGMIRSMEEEGKKNGGVVQPLDHIRRASLRLIARLCFGADFAEDDLMEAIDKVVELVVKGSNFLSPTDVLPFADSIPYLNRSFKAVDAIKRQAEDILGPMLSHPAPPNCFLHVLRSHNQPDEVILMALFEIFVVGLDSTSVTTAWAMAFLVHHQDVQERLYEELVTFSNETKVVKATELSKLPYLQAVVKETMRMKPVAPLGVAHRATADATIWGRKVPKGTDVVVNIYAIHHDEKTWSEPGRFNPDRFLGVVDAGVQSSFMPFGGGMRICAGMEVGKLQVAMLVGNLVKAFKWLPEAEGKLPDLTEEMTFVLLMKNLLSAKILPRGK